jgi:hypothetical protein
MAPSITPRSADSKLKNREFPEIERVDPRHVETAERKPMSSQERRFIQAVNVETASLLAEIERRAAAVSGQERGDFYRRELERVRAEHRGGLWRVVGPIGLSLLVFFAGAAVIPELGLAQSTRQILVYPLLGQMILVLVLVVRRGKRSGALRNVENALRRRVAETSRGAP